MSGGMPLELLAKSSRKGRERLTLEKHLRDTEDAASQIFRIERRWGRNWCRFFRLEEEQRETFLRNLRVAALFHDIGKGNADFYRAVSQPGFHLQTLRHEHISALVLHLPEVRAWLSSNKSLDVEAITAAVLSHHLKASEGGDWSWGQPVGATQLMLFLQHPEIQRILARIAEVAGLEPPPHLPPQPWQDAPPWRQAWQDGRNTATKFRRESKKNPQRWRMLLALKAGLIVSDSVASGLVREGYKILEWIDETVHSDSLTPERLDAAILAPRIAQIEKKRGKPFIYQPFQEQAAQQPDRALLLAACGAGKSLAAWRWAKAQLERHDLGRVLFLYPTRGTATEGFRDYVGLAPETDAAMMHGTARYEIEEILANPDDEQNKDLAKKRLGLSEEEQRLYALAYWSRRYFSATVDQFLGFLEHNYGGLCMLPVLADSAVIIDEVHSFDRRMFDGLVSLLHQFDVPVLCMTATLPPSRREELVNAGLRVFPGPEERAQLWELERLERHARYFLHVVNEPQTGRLQAMEAAIAAYRDGKRVLWVVNRVAECQAIARQLGEALGERPWCYHSRFKLKDRKHAHEGTIAAFQQLIQPAIAITTQVCEMSLDLDADVLITEMAPPSSMVQRFGRANRHLNRGEDFRAQLLVYPPTSSRPYDREDLASAGRFLAQLKAGDCSQQALAEALDKHARSEPQATGDESSFLQGGYYAVAGQFRDADDFAERCILDSDLEKVLGLIASGSTYDGFIVPVPRSEKLREPTEKPLRYLKIASGKNYDPHLGYLTHKED